METNKTHDFNAPIEKTATQLATVVLNKIIENKDILIFEANANRTDEDKKKADETFLDMAISMIQMFATTDLPADYAGLPFDKVIALLNVTKNYVEGTVRQIDDEVLSRFYGVRSPHSGTFAKDVATLGDIMLKRDEIKKATGDKDEDYYITKKAE